MAEFCAIDQDQIVKITPTEDGGCKIEIDGVPYFFNPTPQEGIIGDEQPFEDVDTSEIDEQQRNFIDKIQRCKDQTDSVINEIDEIRERYTNVRIALFRLTEVMDNAKPVFMYHKARFEKFSELIQIFTEHYDKKNDQEVVVNTAQNELNQFLEYYNNLNNPSQSDNETLGELQNNLQVAQQQLNLIIQDYVGDLNDLVYYLNSSDVNAILTAGVNELSQNIYDYAQQLKNQSNNYSSALSITFNEFFNNLLNIMYDVNIFSSTVQIKLAEDLFDNNEVEDLSFLEASENAEMYFVGVDQATEFAGTLYSQYYDLLSDPIANLFTLEERGLTSSPGNIDSGLQRQANEGGARFNTDVSSITTYVYNNETYYIQNKQVFDDFFTNFADKLEAKLEWMRQNVVNPMLNNIANGYVELARKEARYYTANSLLNNFAVQDMISRSEEVVIKYNAMVAEIERLKQLEADLKDQLNPDNIALKMKEEVECVTTLPGNQEPPNDNGGGLKTSYGRYNPDTQEFENLPDKTKPNPTKYCYWNKLAELATIYGLLPFPDPMPKSPGIGMRYWPVGFTVPTPAGLVKIPLPMIWLPLFVLSSPFGTVVLFLNVCGIFPSPMLFYIANQGSKKFILTLRGPSDEVGCSAKFGGVSSNLLKAPSLSGDINVQKSMEQLEKGQSVDDFKTELIDKILQKIDGWGTPELNNVNRLKNKAKKGKEFDMGEILPELKKDIVEWLGGVELPSIRIPKDEGKTKTKNGLDKMLDIGKLFSTEKFKFNLAQSNDLKEKMKLAAIDLYEDPELNDMAANMPVLDLTTEEGKGRFKSFMELFFQKLADVLTTSNLFLSLAAIVDSYTIDTFVCQEAIVEDKDSDLPKAVIISHMAALAANALANISSAELIQVFGFSKLQPSQIFSAALMFISNIIPPIPLPNADFDFSFGSLFKNIALSLASTFIPRISLPLSLPDHIDLDLNGYMSGITNIVDRNLERYVNLLPSGSFGDPTQVLLGISGIDTKVLVNYVIGAHIEPVLDPVFKIAEAFKNLTAFRGFEINALDIVMDPTSVWAKFQEMLGVDMSLDKQLPLWSPDLVAEAMKLLDNLEQIPWPVIGALAAYGNSEVIRNLHPVMRCDDLPPWERLTLDNILFIVFLDDFCHNGKIKGGFFENFYP